jgi:signal transduction histidine kinase
MRDEDKTREELLSDLQRVRMQMAGMVEAEAFRRQAERELEQMTHIAAALVRSSPCGLLVFQRHLPEKLSLINANPQAARLLGKSMDGLRGADLEDMWPNAAIGGFKQSLLNALDTGGPFEASDVPHTGDLRELTLSVSAFRLPEDRLGLYLAHLPERGVHDEMTVLEDVARQTQESTSTDESLPVSKSMDGNGGFHQAEEPSRESDGALQERVEELSDQVRELSAQLLAAHENLAQETQLREAAEEGVGAAWRELEDRVSQRTQALAVANQSLERMIAESHAQEEDLRVVQYELEERLKVQEAEIRELAYTLEIELEEHKKTEEKLVTARIALESHMTDVDGELEAANELLREQVAERRRTESELRSALAERELFIHELTTQLSEATEYLDHETARRTHIERSLSGTSVTPPPLQHSHLGYASLDMDGVVTSFNGRLLEVFGFPPVDDLRGTNLLDTPIMLESGMLDAVKECVQSRVSCTYDGPFSDESGHQRIGRVHFAPMLQDGEHIIGCEAVFEDVSADRLQEGHMMRSERLNALSHMAGRVCDAFSDMVQAVSEHSQAAMACVESASFSDMVPLLEAILAQSRDAGRTARKVRQFARMRPRIETGQDHVFDLTDVVKESLEMDALWSKPPLSNDGHDVLVEPVLTPGCMVQGTEEDYIEVVTNLLENAVEALPSGGKISVSTALDSENVVLEVRDEGIAIPGNHVVNLFEPFWTTREGHQGLGLCVVFGIVRRHGGTLAVRCEEGEGTTFTIRLPYCRSTSREQALGGEEPAHGSFRLLLMYNLEPVAKMVRNKLARLGYSVFTAQSTREGIDILRRTKIDAVVCDFAEEDANVPNVSEAIELLHRETGLRKPPVIILAETVAHGAQSPWIARTPPDRIVQKPVSVARLVEIVAEEIRDAHATIPAYCR